MTRLKWYKANNELVAGPFLCGKDLCIAFISIPMLNVVIQSAAHDYVVVKGAKNITAAKRLAKRELTKLGAKFYDEVRTTRSK
jgi:hypothetical protein